MVLVLFRISEGDEEEGGHSVRAKRVDSMSTLLRGPPCQVGTRPIYQLRLGTEPLGYDVVHHQGAVVDILVIHFNGSELTPSRRLAKERLSSFKTS